jgi:hypothetical protein
MYVPVWPAPSPQNSGGREPPGRSYGRKRVVRTHPIFSRDRWLPPGSRSLDSPEKQVDALRRGHFSKLVRGDALFGDPPAGTPPSDSPWQQATVLIALGGGVPWHATQVR